jgi:hypothetical protein
MRSGGHVRFDIEDVAPKLAQQTLRFFGSSKRVNVVVYVSEQHNDVETGAGGMHRMLQYRMTAVPNKEPRNQTDVFNFLRDGTLGGPDRTGDGILASVADDFALHRAMRDREFFHWVDDLVGRAVLE